VCEVNPTIAKGEKVGTLYLCTGNIDSSISLASTRVDTTLWYHRLGQMSEKGMQILHKRNLFLDLKQFDLDFSEHCVYGKQKRVNFLRVEEENKSERFKLLGMCYSLCMSICVGHIGGLVGGLLAPHSMGTVPPEIFLPRET
jgi:hypothetical protein